MRRLQMQRLLQRRSMRESVRCRAGGRLHARQVRFPKRSVARTCGLEGLTHLILSPFGQVTGRPRGRPLFLRGQKGKKKKSAFTGQSAVSGGQQLMDGFRHKPRGTEKTEQGSRSTRISWIHCGVINVCESAGFRPLPLPPWGTAWPPNLPTVLPLFPKPRHAILGVRNPIVPLSDGTRCLETDRIARLGGWEGGEGLPLQQRVLPACLKAGRHATYGSPQWIGTQDNSCTFLIADRSSAFLVGELPCQRLSRVCCCVHCRFS